MLGFRWIAAAINGIRQARRDAQRRREQIAIARAHVAEYMAKFEMPDTGPEQPPQRVIIPKQRWQVPPEGWMK